MKLSLILGYSIRLEFLAWLAGLLRETHKVLSNDGFCSIEPLRRLESKCPTGRLCIANSEKLIDIIDGVPDDWTAGRWN